jgi:hypothetical protein
LILSKSAHSRELDHEAPPRLAASLNCLDDELAGQHLVGLAFIFQFPVAEDLTGRNGVAKALFLNMRAMLRIAHQIKSKSSLRSEATCWINSE